MALAEHDAVALYFVDWLWLSACCCLRKAGIYPQQGWSGNQLDWLPCLAGTYLLLEAILGWQPPDMEFGKNFTRTQNFVIDLTPK